MENQTLQTLLVAQVLTLATGLETLSKVKDKNVATNWEREAINLIERKSPEVLRLLAEKR